MKNRNFCKNFCKKHFETKQAASESSETACLLSFRRATDGARTRDLHLGKVAYYQLYYCRIYLSLMYLSDEIYNNTASYVWQAFS